MMEKVLCVCVGNISRSPMMQAVLQQHLGAGFLVESAGLTKELAGRPADPAADMATQIDPAFLLSGVLGISIGSGFIASVITAVVGAAILLAIVSAIKRA